VDSCGIRLSEVGLFEIRKPQVSFFKLPKQILEFQSGGEGPTTVGSLALHCAHSFFDARRAKEAGQRDGLNGEGLMVSQLRTSK